MAIGHGGQTLCSQATAAVVGVDAPDGAVLVDLGERRLRDVSEPIRVFQVRHPDLRTDFPPLRSVDAVATNLPIVRTDRIGRSSEIDMLTALCGSRSLEGRLVAASTGFGFARLGAQDDAGVQRES
jgi:hypothetical protein